mmetsp:Transcript_15812/g.46941  ORF Transcript_15812/g.46941 Transcript_15812/m.46941 type:complete len:161 (-) Transcript_15812:61-543(-)
MGGAVCKTEGAACLCDAEGKKIEELTPSMKSDGEVSPSPPLQVNQVAFDVGDPLAGGKIEPPTAAAPPNAAAPPSAPGMDMGPTLQAMQGKWKRQNDGAAMGFVAGNQVFWDPTFRHAPTTLTQAASGDVEMEMSGAKHTGKCQTGSIVWSDGEVWVPAA